MITEKVKNFTADVYKIIAEKDMDFIEAVLYWAETNNVEIELVAEMVKRNANLLEDIRLDAESLHFLEKTPRLPI